MRPARMFKSTYDYSVYIGKFRVRDISSNVKALVNSKIRFYLDEKKDYSKLWIDKAYIKMDRSPLLA